MNNITEGTKVVVLDNGIECDVIDICFQEGRKVYACESVEEYPKGYETERFALFYRFEDEIKVL